MRSPKKKIKKITEPDFELFYDEVRDTTPLRPKTIAQANYIRAIDSSQIIFSSGPAGTGKTYVAAVKAAEAIERNPELKLILVRPVVEAGESLGFLPGELEEKYAPYLEPFMDILEQRLERGFVRRLLQTGRIVAKPLAYMRGKTFDNSWVILDEAQNTTPKQMKLFLTRIGKNSKFIIDGDSDQVDIKGPNGLEDAFNRLRDIESIRFIKFSPHDIVRNDVIKEILQAYGN